VAEVILATPLRRFIQASPLWRRKPASANRRLTVSAAARNARLSHFKLHLAQSLAHGTLYVNRNVDEDDSVEYTGKF
jgi:RpiR family carbohydrate utilization transcriptional regulator